ncbi:MAG: hypothetical protein OSB69_20305 [Alphaproteobacteria bacterium]|nr:hypothetical protein [Alphaproteobacteria bacterium]
MARRILLYSLYEANRSLMTPMHAAARSGLAISKSPMLSEFTAALGRNSETALEVVEGMMQRRGKPEWRVPATAINGAWVRVTEEMIVDKPFGKLLRFRRQGYHVDPKILIVAPMLGHFSTLLRNTVRGLLSNHDFCITDWKYAATVPLPSGSFNVDDYVAYLINFMRKMGPDHQVMAVCQPASLAIVAVAVMARLYDPNQPKPAQNNPRL